MLLGQRFEVVILFPAAVLVVAVAIAGGIGRGEVHWLIVLTAAAGTVSLQIGYLLGLVIPYSPIGVLAKPSDVNYVAGSTPTRRLVR